MDKGVIELLGTLFWVCLSLAILFFLISVALFFIFDIRSIFNIRTGRAQAKTVKEMKAANESTGRLRVAGKTQTSKLSGADVKNPRVATVTPPSQEFIKKNYNTDSAPQFSDNTANATTETLGAKETEVLGVNETEVLGSNETQVLGGNETEVLGLNETQVLGSNETEVIGSNETQVLSPQYDSAAQETRVLGGAGSAEYAETSVLSNQGGAQPAVEYLDSEPRVGFKVIKKDMYIHTNEMI